MTSGTQGAPPELSRGPSTSLRSARDDSGFSPANYYSRHAIAAWPWLAAALSGFLLTLCFPRENQSWLCWLGLTPLIGAVWFGGSGRRWKNAALGYVAGLVFFTGTFIWLGSLAELASSPWLLAIPPLIALYMALYFAFWSWVVSEIGTKGYDFTQSGKNVRIAFICASAWVAHEWVRGWLFSGFGWNGLGVGLHEKIALIQIVEWTGVAGLSFLAVFVNVIAVVTVRRFVAEIMRGRVRAHWDFSLAVALVCLVFAFGVRALQKNAPSTTLRVAAVQGNIPQNEKWDDDFEQKIFDRYRDLTIFAAELKPQLLIWPEASLPGPLFVEPNFTFVRDLAAHGDYALLLGSLDFDLAGEKRTDFNAAILVSERGERMQTYRKNHLVPFGEFIPFRNSFPLFAMLVGELVPGDISSGHELTVLEMAEPPVKIAALICFEDTVGELARKFVLGGAQVLVNITNDGWFMRSEGAEQHLANAVFRAVETRRPLLRAANTGVTCFIDSHGRITQSLRGADGTPFVEGVLSGKVQIPTSGVLTFYTRHGEVFSVVCFVITVIFVALRIKARWRVAESGERGASKG